MNKPSTVGTKDSYWLGEHRRDIFGGCRHLATVHTAFGVWDTNEANADLMSAAPDKAALDAMYACFGTFVAYGIYNGVEDGMDRHCQSTWPRRWK